VAPFFDGILVGDGEEATLEICRRIRERKRRHFRGKEGLLSELATIRGVYIPSFFEVKYGSDGTINTIEPLKKGYEVVEKAVIPDIDHYPFPCAQVVPLTELVHDRLAIEISRGCTRGCRFCQAGMIYRPVRERNPESVIRNIQLALKHTGFEEISLLSLSSGDYGCLGRLLEELMDRHSEDKVAISLPSLRVDSMDPAWFSQIKRVRKTGFTLAPEAGNDRLRRVINKGLTNGDILDIAREVYGAGWNLIKLYFMIGLPGEDDEDLQDIVHLAKEVVNLAKGSRNRAKLNVSVSTFVPKSHTPFMWAPQIPLEESRRRIELIRSALRKSPIRVKWNQPELSWLEGIFARGDRKLHRALREAWEQGARFDAWREHFKMDIWKEAFARTGLNPGFYLYRQRSRDEILPWDHIRSGIEKAYLKEEWQKAMEQKTTPDCRRQCQGCGVCTHDNIGPVIFEEWPSPSRMEAPSLNRNPALIKKCRLSFSKTGQAGYLSHLELIRLFVRAFKRAGLSLVYSAGYHPMPRLSFAGALPVGTESLHETADIELYDPGPMSVLKTRINEQLPAGLDVTSLEDITHEKRSPILRESHFHISTNGLDLRQADLERFLRSDNFPIVKMGKKGGQIVNARSVVKSMDLSPAHGLNLVITHVSGPQLRPVDIVKGVFHLDEHRIQGMKIVKTGQVLG
jgi:radical SAM family uncharacterized protein/radical SAM-linked protein